MIIPTWAKILLVIALMGGLYYLGYNEGENDCIAKQTTSELSTLKESVDYERGLMDDLRVTSIKLQDALTNVRTVTEWRTRTVTNEVEKPVYKSCIIPASGVEILNENVAKLNGLRSK